MYALFSSLVAKAIVFAAGLIAGAIGFPGTAIISKVPEPVFVLVSLSSSDTSRAQHSSSSSETKKASKTITVTITDEGISIEGNEALKRKIEAKKLAEMSEKLEIEARKLEEMGQKIDTEVRAKLEAMPESIRVAILKEGDTDRFKRFETSDIVRWGEDVKVDTDELVTGDIVTIRGDIEIEGKVTGDVVAIMGKVALGPESIVNGDVVCIFGTLVREEGSIVRGETAVVGKSIKNRQGTVFPFGSFAEGIIGGFVRIGLFIVGIFVVLLLVFFIPGRMSAAAQYEIRSFLKSFGAGLLIFFGGIVIVAILAVIFAVTIIGIPLAILVVLSFLALLIIGYSVCAIALGSFLYRKTGMQTDSVFLAAILGLFLLAIWNIVGAFVGINPLLSPFGSVLSAIGSIAQFVAVVAGTGAFVLSKAGSRSTGGKASVLEENRTA